MVDPPANILGLIGRDALSGGERHQIVEAPSQSSVPEGSWPSINDHAVHDENRHGLTANTIEIPDTVVETPLDVVGEQSSRFLLSGSQITAASNSKERHLVDIIVRHLIDDGQLPSAHPSPFGPEDHEDGLHFLTQHEFTSGLKSEREVWSRRSIGRRRGLA